MEQEEYEWDGIGPEGLVTVVGSGQGQSFARQHKLKGLLVTGPKLTFPFRIDIPEGALPVIQQKHSVTVATDGGSQTTKLYQFGWEKNGTRRMWEFGGSEIVLIEE